MIMAGIPWPPNRSRSLACWNLAYSCFIYPNDAFRCQRSRVSEQIGHSLYSSSWYIGNHSRVCNIFTRAHICSSAKCWWKVMFLLILVRLCCRKVVEITNSWIVKNNYHVTVLNLSSETFNINTFLNIDLLIFHRAANCKELFRCREVTISCYRSFTPQPNWRREFKDRIVPKTPFVPSIWGIFPLTSHSQVRWPTSSLGEGLCCARLIIPELNL